MEGLEIKLHITKVLPVQKINSKTQPITYDKYGFVGQTEDKFPKDVYFTMFNPEANVCLPRVGDEIVASIDISSRSFVGKDNVERWMTEVQAWRVQYVYNDGSLGSSRQFNSSPSQAQPVPSQPQQVGYAPQQMENQVPPIANDDDLPF